ncbi:hypothetical protein N7456_003032 [Penicillium angulare]|uniref:Uncharacterized protein n=1 Tax=Penicillium angulare TaxID=116970 RepID=A0A9W9FVD8_9EURO|nr:hypothetical protein N7456_003032 [Penicillium angulare]
MLRISCIQGAVQLHHSIRSSSDSSDDKTYHLSGGAITGIVVVCFAAVAIVLLIIFRKQVVICCARKKNIVADEEQTLPPPAYVSSQTQLATHDASYKDRSPWKPAEMSSDQNAVHEIGQPAPHELSSVHGNSNQPERVLHELS